MADKIVKINVSVSLGTTSATETIEVDISLCKNEGDIEKVKEEAGKEWMFNTINWGWADE